MGNAAGGVEGRLRGGGGGGRGREGDDKADKTIHEMRQGPQGRASARCNRVTHLQTTEKRLVIFFDGGSEKIERSWGRPGATSRHTASVISTDFFLRFQYFQGVFAFFDRLAVRPSFRIVSINPPFLWPGVRSASPFR